MWSAIILIGFLYLLYKVGFLKAIGLVVVGIAAISFLGSFLGVLI